MVVYSLPQNSNPFLSSELHLPPVTAFELDEIQYEHTVSLLCKAVLSADPVLEPTNFQILAIECGRNDSGLSFYKPGDKAWTSIDSQFDMITDVIHYRDKLYVFSIDLNHPKPKVLTVALRPPRKYSDKRYLVELSGDLLQILRYFARRSEDEDKDFPDYVTTNGFDVFKLDQFKRKWILLDNLGGHVLFLGDNATYCVSASDFPECEPNSIYFTDAYYDLDRDIDRDNGAVPHDMVVFRFRLQPVLITI